MRTLNLIVVAFALAGPPGSAWAAPDDPGVALRSAAEECVRANAPRVTAAAQTLTEAVSFLVDDLCAREIVRSDTYQTSVQTLAAMQANPPKPRFATSATHPVLSEYEQEQNAETEHQAALAKQAKVDPKTGELDTAADFDLTFRTKAMIGPLFGLGQAAAEFKSIAAKAVLDARESAAKH